MRKSSNKSKRRQEEEKVTKNETNKKVLSKMEEIK